MVGARDDAQVHAVVIPSSDCPCFAICVDSKDGTDALGIFCEFFLA